jgi:hypothetical protein
MKKAILFLAMLLLVSTVEAKNNSLESNKGIDKSTYHRPITFQENGVKFYVFANGDVEFQKNRRYTSNHTYYRGRNGSRYYNSSPRRILVRYDRRGNLMRVGNVHLPYNYFGQVTQIGTVPVFYTWKYQTSWRLIY